MIAIIDYGGGNIGSVKNALDYLNITNIITENADEIKKADKIILPGQGRFGDVMRKLQTKKLDKVLVAEIKSGKPYLGICIGLQILFERSEEDPDVKGLGVLPGKVQKFATKLKIPQIGWNKVEQRKESLLFDSINDTYFYFVHSFYPDPVEKIDVLTETKYGVKFCSAIEKENIYAVQFHPEKSGETGLRLLENFREV